MAVALSAALTLALRRPTNRVIRYSGNLVRSGKHARK